MEKEYQTVLNTVTEEIVEKKSKFMSHVKPISYLDDANEFIDGIRSKYWDATHNVYCYYLNNDNTITQKYSDDGEPSGTAAVPILEVIKRLDVINIAVVVTRYFGGTLLGASGLIRAYGKSALLGIQKATIVKKKLCTEVNIVFEYSLLGKIQNLILANKYKIKNIIYNQNVEIILYVFVDDMEKFYSLMNEVTNSNIDIRENENYYITYD